MKIGREAGDEDERGRDHRAPARALELGRGEPGDRREVAGHERQDARREERDAAGEEGGEQSDAADSITRHRRPPL